MYETILLTEDNLHEVARKTGRAEVDLHDELATAQDEGRILFITVITPQARDELKWLIDNMGDVLQKTGLSLEEFVELVKEDIERAHRGRMDSLMRSLTREQLEPTVLILTEANIDNYDLPTKLGMSKDDLMELVFVDQKHHRVRTVEIRDPGQWVRARKDLERSLAKQRNRRG